MVQENPRSSERYSITRSIEQGLCVLLSFATALRLPNDKATANSTCSEPECGPGDPHAARNSQAYRKGTKKLKGSSQKVRRAQMLLKADEAGPGWTDEWIADAFDSRTRTVEKWRERFVTDGFEQTLNGKKRDKPPTEKKLSGN